MFDKVIAIDPGVTSGIATRIDGKYNTFEAIDYRAVWHIIYSVRNFDVLLCENFAATTISSYGLHTVRLIGGLEALCLEHNIPYMTQQNARRVKYKYKAIQIMGQKGPRDHMMDALAHLLCWENEVEGKQVE